MRQALAAIALLFVLVLVAWWRADPGPRVPPHHPRKADRAMVGELLREAGWRQGETAAASGRDVVLIVLDTVRADRLDLYGHDVVTMPNLTAWAGGARVYEQARSTSSWTLPAHASLFTGLYPTAHGARWAPNASVKAWALPHDLTTIAEAVHARGWRTAGVVANVGFLTHRMHMDQGFEVWVNREFDRLSDGANYPRAGRVTDAAIQVLRQRTDEPLFLFVNYMDAHGPIVPTHDLQGRRLDEHLLPYRGQWLAKARATHGGEPPWDLDELKAEWARGYDAELHGLDEHLGRLLDALPRNGVDEDDLVIVVSDHGESFGDHEVMAHAKALYDDLLHVPLLVRGAGFEPGRDARPVQLVDVHRWMAEATGVDAPASLPSEVGMAELYSTRNHAIDDARALAHPDRLLRAWWRGEHKVIVGDDGSVEAYDLATDPAETAPLDDAPWQGELVREGLRILTAGGQRDGDAEETDEADLEALRALGYVE